MNSHATSSTRREQVRDILAPLMFFASLAFLLQISALLVFWIDVPRVVEVVAEQASWDVVRFIDPPLSAAEQAYQNAAYLWGERMVASLGCLWLLFLTEAIIVFNMRDRQVPFLQQHPYFWIGLAIPPLRMCMRDRIAGDRMWFPVIGWQVVDRQLRRRMERIFSIPMMWIALLILPVLICQMFFKTEIITYPWLRFALHLSAGIIWFAFAFEFVVMVSVSNDKLLYCLKHWLDILIMVLPLVSFMRSLSILRANNLMQLGQMQEAARIVRVYRVRGVALRGFRAFVLLNVFQRLFRVSPKRRLARLRETIADRKDDLAELERQASELEHQLEERDLQN